jgi:tetratricopeptide (TPR) repeat protein
VVEEAAAAYRESIALDASDPYVLAEFAKFLLDLAQVYLWQWRPQLAAEVLEEAMRYRPGHPLLQSLMVELGDAYVGIQEPGKARAVYLRVLEMSDAENLEAVREKLEALEE